MILYWGVALQIFFSFFPPFFLAQNLNPLLRSIDELEEMPKNVHSLPQQNRGMPRGSHGFNAFFITFCISRDCMSEAIQ